MSTSGALASNTGSPSLKFGSPSLKFGSPSLKSGSPSLGSSRAAAKSGSLYIKRVKENFTDDERDHLENLKKDSLLQKLHVFSVFKEPSQQLENWLYFFDGTDDHHTYGSEMQQGLVHLWSTFILMEALLAGVATQPFISTQGLQGWKLTSYGVLWMLSLLADFFALGTTALFLGYLLSNPGKLSWIWLCKIGALRGIPAVMMLSATFMSLVAIGFTTFVLYGWKAGVVCMVFEGFIVGAGVLFAVQLSAASDQVIESQLKTL